MIPILSFAALAITGVPGLQAATHPRLVITPEAGFTITWDGNNGGFSSPDAGAAPGDNIALASRGTVPFTSSDLGDVLSLAFHRAVNLNDGLYGNANSWISANGAGGSSDPDPFAGLAFPASTNISGIAWGRDNGDSAERAAPFTDRTVGTYTLQVTTVASPGGGTAETGDAATGWANIGTVQYLPGPDDAFFISYLRHRFDVASGGSPIAATGLRVKVSDGNLDIDEIEVNPPADPVPPITDFIDVVSEPGFSVQWDRNEANFSTVNDPAPVPQNAASTGAGTVAFTSSNAGEALGIPYHRALNLNDGLYGNANSWIPNFIAGDASPSAGLNFGHRISIRNIAWGRDNGNNVEGAPFTDRALGIYLLQITTTPNPGAATPDASWVTVATINYKADHPALFNSYLRHRFDLSQGGAPVSATGIRIKVPNASSAIDEIEVNSNVAVEQDVIQITNAPGATLLWDGNDGHFNDPAVGAAPPANAALASEGTVPFTSSELGEVLSLPFHRAVNLNDGLYGNANSWISANGTGGTSDPDPFAGLRFGGTTAITNIAWGRDNGNVDGDCCTGTLTDRALGTYRFQYTTIALPDALTPDTGDAATGWQDVASVTYVSPLAGYFTPYLRHRFDVSSGGLPLQATGIRIKVSDGNIAIDEIEINTATAPPAVPLEFTSAVLSGDGQSIALTWESIPGAFYTLERSTTLQENDWPDVLNAIPSQGLQTTASAPAGGSRGFYRILLE